MEITSVGKDVEKLESLCLIDGSEKWGSHCGKAGGSTKN
jgi:hypothetical protein